MPKTKRPAAKADKKCWSESFGVYGATIRIAEREPGGVLYLLWLDKKGKQQKRSLGHRDRREGKREALAATSAMMQANAAVRGVVIINPQPQPEKQTKQDAPAPLTLAQGVERMFDPLKGAYATVNDHVRQAKRYTEAAVVLLDQDLTWRISRRAR